MILKALTHNIAIILLVNELFYRASHTRFRAREIDAASV
jgi:hypothetical protein